MENSTGSAAPADTGSSDSAPVSDDVQTDSSEQGAEGTKEQKAAVAAIKKKFKYKVDGEDVEEEIDLSNDEELTKRFRLSRAAEKRMAEAKSEKSKAFDIVKKFEDDPESILSRLGPRGREVAEKFLLKQIQEEMLSPEEKAQRTRDEKASKWDAAEEKRTKDEQTSAEEKQSNAIAQDYQNTIIGALKKLNLPATPTLFKNMAAMMQKSLKLGLELDASDLAEKIRADRDGEVKAITKDMDGDQLIAFFGDDIANKIRRSDLRKLQEKQSAVFGERPSPSRGNDEPAPKGTRPMSIDEWKASVDARLKSE